MSPSIAFWPRIGRKWLTAVALLLGVHAAPLDARAKAGGSTGDVAVLRGIADNTGSFRGFGFSGKLWYTRVFVRRDGRWQAVAMQHTLIQ